MKSEASMFTGGGGGGGGEFTQPKSMEYNFIKNGVTTVKEIPF
jgi:hypothetical protein